MDFSEPDEAPEDVLNRVIWHSVKGYDVPYPYPFVHEPVCIPVLRKPGAGGSCTDERDGANAKLMIVDGAKCVEHGCRRRAGGEASGILRDWHYAPRGRPFDGSSS